jgi:hypothetical protein
MLARIDQEKFNAVAKDTGRSHRAIDALHDIA